MQDQSARELEGQVAVVTGAAQGIGAACARALAAAGADLVLLDRASAEVVAVDLRAAGARVAVAPCDVAESASVDAAFREVAAFAGSAGGASVVVHAAGVLLEAPLLETSDAAFEHVIGVNLRGTFLVGRAGVAGLRARGGGRFIAIGSDLARLGRADFSAYCASKAGVSGLVRAWAREFAPSVLVNAIAPGPIDTPMLRGAAMSDDWRDKEADIPLGRIGRPEEVAAMARFLAGPGGAFVTGQTIHVDGGAAMP